MLQEIIAYRKVAAQLDELIDKSPYKKKYIIEQVRFVESNILQKTSNSNIYN